MKVFGGGDWTARTVRTLVLILVLAVTGCASGDSTDDADTADTAESTDDADAAENTDDADAAENTDDADAAESTDDATADADSSGGGDETVASSPDDGVLDDRILVGWMGDATGAAVATSPAQAAGTEAYFAFVNEGGGVAGRQLELIVTDDGYGVEPAFTNFRRLVSDDRVLAITNMGGSHIVEALNQDIEAAAVPIIGPQQTIDTQLENPYFWNTQSHYGDQADVVVAKMVEDVGSAEDLVVASLGLEVASGEEWGAYIRDSVEKAGGTYVTHLRIAPQATEASAQVSQIERLMESEGVNYLALHGSAGTALTVLGGLGNAGVAIPIGGNFGVIAENVCREAPDGIIDGFFGAHSFSPTNIDVPGNQALLDFIEGTEWADDAGVTDVVQGWVNARILVEGINRAVEQSGELTRGSLQDALGTITDFDTEGQTGTIDFSRDGHHGGAVARPYECGDDDRLSAIGDYADWAEHIDFEYGLAGG